jgi:GTPase SAR1 family protein
MNPDQIKILLIGLPETGKTSFLAAFVHYVDAPIENKNLSQYQLSSNSTYIASIVQDWLKGKKPERTKITAAKNENTIADVFLVDKTSGSKFTLHVPDYYGETFENQFFDRHIELDFIEQVKTCSGILLFIHPDRVKQPTLIEDVKIAHQVEEIVNKKFEPVIKEIEVPPLDEFKEEQFENEIESVPKIIPSFRVEESPTQIILVDLLEAYLEYIPSLPVKVALIISAWDIVKNDIPELSPMKWIENLLPLLYQFLYTNSEKIIFKSYGISAIGGDIKDPKEVERLTSLHEPADRIFVQEEELDHKNIASPIEWILQQCQKPTI